LPVASASASAYVCTNAVQPGQSSALLNGIESPTTTSDSPAAGLALAALGEADGAEAEALAEGALGGAVDADRTPVPGDEHPMTSTDVSNHAADDGRRIATLPSPGTEPDQNRAIRRFVGLVFAVLIATGCSPAVPSPVPTVQPSSTIAVSPASSEARSPAASGRRSALPLPAGELQPGVYTRPGFEPPVTFEVGEGWPVASKDPRLGWSAGRPASSLDR
jgi:hypothetical protein